MKTWFKIFAIEDDRIKVKPLVPEGTLSQSETYLRGINEDAIVKVRGLLEKNISEAELDHLGGFLFDVTDHGISLVEKAEKLAKQITDKKRPWYPSMAQTDSLSESHEDQPKRLSDAEISRSVSRAVDAVMAENSHVRVRNPKKRGLENV